jgi:hypothetical protein
MSTRIVPISGPLEPKGEHVSFDLSLTPLCGACEPFDHQNLLEPIALNSRLPFAEAVLEQPSDVEGVRCHNHLLRRDVIIPRVIFDEPVPRRVRHERKRQLAVQWHSHRCCRHMVWSRKECRKLGRPARPRDERQRWME